MIFFFLIASGLRPKNKVLINLLIFATALRQYLPFFDIDERRLKFDVVENSILLLKTSIASFVLNITSF